MAAAAAELPRAWLVAAACAVGMMVSVVPFHIGTFPVFLGPVSETFGWGRAAFAMSVNVSALLAAASAPLVGRAVDRLGARMVLLPALVVYALATMSQALLTELKLQFYATYAVLGLSEAVAGPVAYSQIVSTWFHERRGLALALVMGAAPTISIAITVPLVHLAIEGFGWRAAYVVLGGVILVVGFPALLLALRHAPPSVPGTGGRGAVPATAPGMSLGRTLATATFWIILAALVIHSLVVGGVRGHTYVMLTDRGISGGMATLALSTMALAGLAGNVASGVLMDRIPSPRVALPFFVVALLGLLTLDHAPGGLGAVIGAGVLGFGIGAESGLGPYFVSRYFGLRSFGTIYGCIIAGFAISSGLGPFLLGKSFDATGSYRFGLNLAELGLGLGIVLVAVLGPYVYPARGAQQEAEAIP